MLRRECLKLFGCMTIATTAVNDVKLIARQPQEQLLPPLPKEFEGFQVAIFGDNGFKVKALAKAVETHEGPLEQCRAVTVHFEVIDFKASQHIKAYIVTLPDGTFWKDDKLDLPFITNGDRLELHYTLEFKRVCDLSKMKYWKRNYHLLGQRRRQQLAYYDGDNRTGNWHT